ncbi:hypothetical protein [Paenibacillus camelliae]|uniref:hypothetical protein n=1 Tax=Paenibacillus camelliae TaxID=512410 RepID=UPI00203A85CD|nr:hypothetical protein [Paenibacillus camelliae]MCM3635234.1 hypothetical protein [Paenibacillus camelliae]
MVYQLYKEIFSRKSLILILSLTLMLLCIPNVKADGLSNQSVKVASDISVSLYDVESMKNETGQIFAFTLEFKNNSSSSLPLIDYWARIKGKSNKSYVTKLIEADKTKQIVPSKGTTYLTYYTNAEASASLNDFQINIIKWDFSVSSYERVIGTLSAKDYKITPYKRSKEILIDSNKLNVLISNYIMYRDQEYGYINFDMAIRNLSSKSINLDNLKFQASVGGKSYTITPSYETLTLKGNERKSLTLGVSIPVEALSKELIINGYIDPSEGEFGIPKFSIQLLNLVDTPAVDINTAKIVRINDTSIAFQSDKSTVKTNNNKTELETKITLENKSTFPVAIPDVKYYLKTKEGYLYPLNLAKEEEAGNLLPNIKKEISLVGLIPDSKSLSNSQIVVMQEKDSYRNFLANFKLALGASTGPTTNPTASTTYEGLKIEQISSQRTPNDLMDLVVAEFKVTNTSSTAKSKLDLSGQFVLDGVALPATMTKVYNVDPILALSPNQSYRMLVYTQIPYTQTVNKLGFKMIDNEKESDVHTFTVDNLRNAQLLASNQKYEIDSAGKRADVKLLNSYMYEGGQTNLFYAELEYTNKERRTIVPGELKGYITNKDDEIIDLNFAKYEQRLLPSGKLVLSAWAVIPKNFEQEQLEFYFGESLALAETEIEAVLNPVYTRHVFTDRQPTNSFEKLPFSQYDVSLRYITAVPAISDGFIADSIELSFEYDVEIRENASAYSDEHSILVEFVDPNVPAISFSKEFTINKDKTEATETTDSNLLLGKNKEMKFMYTNDLLRNRFINQYTLNIYDVYKGHKRLIATKQLTFNEIVK